MGAVVEPTSISLVVDAAIPRLLVTVNVTLNVPIVVNVFVTVLPLADDVGKRLNSDLAGRPVLIKGNRQILFGGMGRLSENSVINIKNKSHTVTAELVVPPADARGVILAPGRNIGGCVLCVHQGKPTY